MQYTLPEGIRVPSVQERYREAERREEVRRQAVALARIATDPKALALFDALDEREWRSMKDLCEATGMPYGNTSYIGSYRRLLHDATPLLVDAPPPMNGPQIFQRTEFGTMFLEAVRDELRRMRPPEATHHEP